MNQSAPQNGPSVLADASSPAVFALSSDAAPDGSILEHAQLSPEQGGPSLSPDLRWSGAPKGTRSFAVTCYDPDAPTGSGFWHWIAWDIPADASGLPPGAEREASGMLQAVNDFGRPGYDGPNPPEGPAHRYVFTVHALPVETLGIDPSAPHVQARFAIVTQQLASASITATYRAPA
ncbi:YbhB/YbcL family Raf kinase inhibitor-like protein [Brachybacterium sp. JHP9]|uniref:YbhB/YbcL family Raf kinase inhibitor-like protein n=1 Tax=Brachybacterium equifaecis TaxID=2910770 RepID=A0ABT0QWD1_9MICO|nr:YbhB/YbcL family Raf kinase inhibitor-like protein [Brachybacterium equifaecis]MCL6421895.1 YbhB/YbcL family Raf kinase inhibitor-like protein [Brachybacterium equifaecis]